MFSTDDFFAYTGATPAPKKTTTAPSRTNLQEIRKQVTTAAKTGNMPLTQVAKSFPTNNVIIGSVPKYTWKIEETAPVNILSDEFMNGNLKISSRFANPQPKPAPPPAPPIIKNAGELFQRVTQATEARNKAITAAVIMPKDNQPPRTILIDSDAMRVTRPLQIVMYSEASFAVFGTTDSKATKTYKDDLQSLGGKFNAWLKRDGKPTPGYIFPLWRLDNVKKYLERF